MRTMTRNRQTFYEAPFVSTAMAKDSSGIYTEETTTYGTVTERKGVITPANGQADTQLFGINEIYDKVITLNKNENYLAVGSVLWVDTMPIYDEQGNVTNAYDYVVVKVAESLNFISVAIRKVQVAY